MVPLGSTKIGCKMVCNVCHGSRTKNQHPYVYTDEIVMALPRIKKKLKQTWVPGKLVEGNEKYIALNNDGWKNNRFLVKIYRIRLSWTIFPRHYTHRIHVWYIYLYTLIIDPIKINLIHGSVNIRIVPWIHHGCIYITDTVNWGKSSDFMGYYYTTLPETNSSHLKMDGWNTIVSFWDGRFSGAFAVSFREDSMQFCGKSYTSGYFCMYFEYVWLGVMCSIPPGPHPWVNHIC